MKEPKLLLDENIGKRVYLWLKEKGYDIVSIIEESPGIEDIKILKRALKENRIVVTLDRDFGRLIFKNSNKHVGVLLLRLKEESAKNIFNTIVRVINQYGEKIKGKFTVVTESRVRIRQ